jgi:multiple sugar transport system substrate-binding protein
MKRRIMKRIVVLACALFVSVGFAQVRVFIGSTLRPDVIGPILEEFTAETGIETEIEEGGATTEVRDQYLSTVLTSRSGDIDLFLMDVVNPPQYAAAGWAEPLDDYFESEAARDEFLEPFLDSVVTANTVDGTLYGLPGWTDAQFLYYRSDLLEKYGFEPPTTWEELKEQALAILEGEGDPTLQGFNYQGAAIEGTNCTFLEALWTAGGDWRAEDGSITVDSDAGRTALAWYDETLESGITKEGIAEETTDLSRQAFQAGDVVFMLNWGYAWAHFQEDEDSAVKGNVGVAPLPAFEGGESATCVGGFQWAINPFSDNKEEAFRVMQHMVSYEAQKTLAIEASHIPAREALYEDEEVLAAAPQFGQFFDVIVNARPRPLTPFYGEVSELIRTSMNAFFARAQDADETLAQMQSGLEDILEP